MSKSKQSATTDAVEILHRRYYEGRPERLAALEETRLFEIDNVVRSTLRTAWLSVCETGRYHEGVAVLRVREMYDCLL